MKNAIKVSFLLLSALLIAQFCQPTETKALDDSKDAEELKEISMLFTSSNEGEKLSPQVQLKVAVMHECAPLFEFTMRQGKKIFQNVLKDSEVLTNPSDELETHLAEFSQFVEVVEKAESLDRVKFLDALEIANRFKSLVAKYSSNLEQPSAVELVIAVALKRNGLPELKSEFNKRFLDTVPKFYAKVDAYLDSMSAEQRTQEKILNDWYASFKEEQNVEKKRAIFGEIFKL